jgi:small GTP-binding protein
LIVVVVVLQSPLNVFDTVYSKTTIMKRVLGEDHHEICPTVGFNIKTLEYKGLNLNLWDVGGQKSIRTYWRNYFEQTDGIIWVVDSVDRWRLEECKMHLKDLLTQEVSAHVCFVLWQETKCQRYLPLYFAFMV